MIPVNFVGRKKSFKINWNLGCQAKFFCCGFLWRWSVLLSALCGPVIYRCCPRNGHFSLVQWDPCSLLALIPVGKKVSHKTEPARDRYMIYGHGESGDTLVDVHSTLRECIQHFKTTFRACPRSPWTDLEGRKESFTPLVWSGLVWSGLVWSGLVWSGLVWSGLVWSNLVWSGLVWSGLTNWIDARDIKQRKKALVDVMFLCRQFLNG